MSNLKNPLLEPTPELRSLLVSRLQPTASRLPPPGARLTRVTKGAKSCQKVPKGANAPLDLWSGVRGLLHFPISSFPLALPQRARENVVQKGAERCKKVQKSAVGLCSPVLNRSECPFADDISGKFQSLSRSVTICHVLSPLAPPVHPIQNGPVHFQPSFSTVALPAQHTFPKQVMQTRKIQNGPSVSIFGPFCSILKSAALAIPPFCLWGSLHETLPQRKRILVKKR